MRKEAKANVTRNGDIITVDYNPKAPIEERVNTLAECVNLLAKSIMSVSNKVDEQEKILSDVVECCSNLITDVQDLNDEVFYS